MQVGAARRGRRWGYPGGWFLARKHRLRGQAPARGRSRPGRASRPRDAGRPCAVHDRGLERGVALRRARIEGLGHGARVATGGVVHRALCVFITLLPEASACTSGTVPFRSLPARFLRAPDPSASPAATAGAWCCRAPSSGAPGGITARPSRFLRASETVSRFPAARSAHHRGPPRSCSDAAGPSRPARSSRRGTETHRFRRSSSRCARSSPCSTLPTAPAFPSVSTCSHIHSPPFVVRVEEFVVCGGCEFFEVLGHDLFL